MPESSHVHCVPCHESVPLDPERVAAMHRQLHDGWHLLDGRRLEKEYRFADFAAALASANRVGAMAEMEGHHPTLVISWGSLRVSWWTHKCDGLTESDFALAAQTDQRCGS